MCINLQMLTNIQLDRIPVSKHVFKFEQEFQLNADGKACNGNVYLRDYSHIPGIPAVGSQGINTGSPYSIQLRA